MTGFRFIFADDDEGFELVEEVPTQTASEDEDGDEESPEVEEDIIWETEED